MPDRSTEHDRFQRPTPQEPEHIACEVCLKEIPASTGHSAESGDYLHFFCGLECLKRWKRKAQAEQGPAEGDVRPDL